MDVVARARALEEARARGVSAARAFDAFRGAEVYPGEHVRSDAEIAAAIRAKAETVYHPVGTCRMGVDAESVVDPRLRVRGVEALRATLMKQLHPDDVHRFVEG